MLFSNEQIIEESFKYWRKKGFPFRKLEMFEIMQELNKLKELPINRCISSTLGYKVADTFHNHRFFAAANGMCSPVDSFNDDKKLLKAFKLSLDFNTRITQESCTPTIYIVNGTQACSNFRPAWAKYYIERYGKAGGVYLDPSTGYGGRLIGFLCSNMRKYIGIDPNTVTYKANQQIDQELNSLIGKEIELHNLPFEDTDLGEEIADFIFTSPPYFTKEIYSKENTQSCNRYSEYESWSNNFLKVLMQKCYKYLKNERLCIINIEDVNVKNKHYHLVDDTIKYGAEAGFKFLKNEPLIFNANRVGVKKDGDNGDRKSVTESVLIFYKGQNYKDIMKENEKVKEISVNLEDLF